MAMTFGYTCRGLLDEDIPPEDQKVKIQERFDRGDLPGPLEFFMEHKSAIRLGHRQRPAFREIMRVIRKGDHLIVSRLDRIHARPRGMADAIRWLLNHQIHVHSFGEDCETELDLDATARDLSPCLMEVISRACVRQHKESIIAAFRYRKEHGIACNKNIPMGHRRVKSRDGCEYDVWDETECCQIREIDWMYEEGLSVVEIANAYYRRGEVTAMGKPWVRYDKKQKRLNHARIQDAIRWYKEIRRQGTELGFPDCPPMYINGKRACPPLSPLGAPRFLRTAS